MKGLNKMENIKGWKNIAIIIASVIVAIAILCVLFGFIKKEGFVAKNPIVTMEVENYGTIKIELYPKEAPNTVANFVALINRGFYNGLTFHRTIPDFMIQGGDKEGTGAGKVTLADLKDGGAQKEYAIKGEFLANGVKNTVKHERGTISMARADYSSISPSLLKEGYNSAGSQFFIMQEDNKSLDGLYAAFGKVVEGYDVLDKIARAEVVYRDSELKEGEKAPTNEDGTPISSDKPKTPIVIKSMTVDTFGVDYGNPDTMDAFDYTSWIMSQYQQ